MQRLVDSMLAPLRSAARTDAAPSPGLALMLPGTTDRPARAAGGFWLEAQRIVKDAAEIAGIRADGIGGGWQNPEMGLGGVANRVSRSTFLPSMQLPEIVVDALLQFNGVGRRLCEREPQDATREGFSLGTDPIAERLHDHAVKWGVLRNLRLGRMYARAYGGAGIVMLVDDGQTSDKPLDRTRIRRVNGARVLHRYELTPLRYDEDRESVRVGKPLLYQASFGGRVTKPVHHSRVIIMQGFDLPERVMVRQLGWGGSVFDLAWRSLRNWQVTLDLLPEMASRYSQGVLTQKHLDEGVGAGFAEQIVQRMEALSAGMSVLGDLTLSPEEKYEILSRPGGGMSEIIEALETGVVADGDAPRLILLGETSGGLHAGKDDPQMRAWLDSVAAKQPEDYTPPLEAQLEILALAQEGPTGGELPRLNVKWLPLYQQTQTEKNADAESKSRRRSTDLASRTISSAEARTDPSLRDHYVLDDSTAPAVPGEDPNGDDELLDDEAESVPITAIADSSQIPAGESLIPVMVAARRLGYKSGAPLMRMAQDNRFPIFKPAGRWMVAWSQVDAAVARPHVFAPPAAPPAL